MLSFQMHLWNDKNYNCSLQTTSAKSVVSSSTAPWDCQHFLTGARAKVKRLYLSCGKEIAQLTAKAKGLCPRTVTAAVIALCFLRSVCLSRPTHRLCVFFSNSYLTVFSFYDIFPGGAGRDQMSTQAFLILPTDATVVLIQMTVTDHVLVAKLQL